MEVEGVKLHSVCPTLRQRVDDACLKFCDPTLSINFATIPKQEMMKTTSVPKLMSTLLPLSKYHPVVIEGVSDSFAMYWYRTICREQRTKRADYPFFAAMVDGTL